MDCLCNDVVDIVYRYLFDWRYKIVQNQYRKLWLQRIIWSERWNLFMRDGFVVANYRPRIHNYYIYKFQDFGKCRGTAQLPKGYW